MGCRRLLLLRLSFIILFFSFCYKYNTTVIPDQETTKTYSGLSKEGIALFVVGSTILFVALSIVFCWCYLRIKRHRAATATPTTLIEMSTSVEACHTFTFQELEVATNNFSPANKLGSGGFGVVFVGRLSDGTSVAVKRVNTANLTQSHGVNEFEVELKLLVKVRHRNLVSFLGYCIHLEHRLLVLEYMPNGSLTRHLFPSNGDDSQLTWQQRVKIALDIARGLEYLHNGILVTGQFIHRDIKPNNILLDDHMRAKVADFGLVLITRRMDPVYVSKLAGTVGYMSPEYAVSGKVTTKHDVYAFGIILLELLTGRRAINESASREKVHLGIWLQDVHEVISAIDQGIDHSEEKVHQTVISVSDFALKCIDFDMDKRPEMLDALSVLGKVFDELDTPAHESTTETNEGSTTETFYDCRVSDAIVEIVEEWEPKEVGTSRVITKNTQSSSM